MGLFNLDEQFVFYASYHHDPLNKAIHILCVWPILWTAFVILQYIPIEYSIPSLDWITSIHPLNVTFLAAIFYGFTYIVMDKQAGTIGAFLIFVSIFTGRWFFLNAQNLFDFPAWQIAITIHVLCWILQFVGHGAFEKRSPALLDNLIQAIVMAPLFVLLEVLFALGYRKDAQKKLWTKVEAEIAKLKKGTSSSSKRKNN